MNGVHTGERSVLVQLMNYSKQIMWTSASYFACFALSSVHVVLGVIKINLVAFSSVF